MENNKRKKCEKSIDDTIKKQIQKIIDKSQIIEKIKEEFYINDELNECLIDTIEENIIENVNKCLICKIDIGKSNYRQLCGKTYCLNKDLI